MPAGPILAALLAIALFSGMDAVMKGLGLAIGTFSAVWWRQIVGIGASSLHWWSAGAPRPKPGALRLHVERGAVTSVMSLLFFWSITRLPLAEAIALTFISPLIALLLAAWLLGEAVGRRTIAGSALAFAGVVAIAATRAGGEGARELLGVAAALVSALLYAYNIVLMRKQALLAGPVEIAFFQNLTVIACLALAAPWFVSWPDAGHWPAIVGAAALAQGSLLLFAWAYARAEAKTLAPIEFTAFLWASLFGALFFGERLGPATLAGAALIVAGCWWATRGRDAPAPTPEAAAT